MLAQRPESGPQFGAEQLGLLPGSEMSALLHPIVVNEVAVGALRPALRRLVDLSRKDGHRRRNRDSGRLGGAGTAFPVDPRP